MAEQRELLRRRVAEMDYQKMVQNVAHGGAPTHTPSEVLNTHASVGLNVIAGMGTMAFVGYIGARSVTSDEKWQLAAALFCAVAMMVIEVTLYISRSYTADYAESKKLHTAPAPPPRAAVGASDDAGPAPSPTAKRRRGGKKKSKESVSERKKQQ